MRLKKQQRCFKALVNLTVKIMEKNKTFFIALVGAVFVIGLITSLIIFYRTTGTSPEDAVLESIEKREEAPSYIAEGEIDITMEEMGQEEEMNGVFVTYRSSDGEKQRTDISFQLDDYGGVNQGIQHGTAGEITTSTFILPEGTFSCMKGLEDFYDEIDGWICEEGEDIETGMTLDKEELEEMIEEEEINFTQRHAEKMRVSGRECNYVEMELDTEVIEEHMGESTGGVTMEMNQCYDKETGVPLLEEMKMESPEDSFLMEMEIESLEMEADIPEEIFELPADPIGHYNDLG